MNTRRFLLLNFPVLMLAPDSGGGAGGGTLEDRLAAANSRNTELEGSISSLTTERDTARNDLAAANIRVTSLTGQVTAITAERDTANTSLATANGQITSLTSERDTARLDLSRANLNVTRLENLCGVAGIDINQAPQTGAVTGKTQTLTIASFEERMKAAKNGAERAKIANECQDAINKGLILPG